MLTSVNLLTSTIASDYSRTLAKLERLTSHGEITSDLFYAILIPRSLMVARCAITGLPRIFKLTSWVRTQIDGKPVFQLNMESVDLVDRPLTHSVVVGRVQTIVYIRPMVGTVKIDSLDAYPLKFHADPEGLKESIMKRGKKWVSLIGVHHKQFDGLAALKVGEKLIKHNVCILFLLISKVILTPFLKVRGRIMVDRATFRRLNSNYQLPTPVPPKGEENAGPPMQLDSRFGPQFDSYGNPIPQPVAIFAQGS